MYSLTRRHLSFGLFEDRWGVIDCCCVAGPKWFGAKAIIRQVDYHGTTKEIYLLFD